ncbi:hypothetical protein ACET3X_008432 [Alternaria dauci]|uniref:Uncharacterized protein n=1 Tax=Alternaria dauci TaxID=48095 RepID=A0ABR3UAV3_9PLEO
MEAYLPPRYYEPQSDLFAFSLVMGFAMFVLLAGYKVATYSTITKTSPEIGMTKRELQELVRKVVKNEVEITKRCMAARESLLDEAIDTVHQHEARIAALEENYDKAMEEMGAFRASMSSPISNNPPVASLVQSPRSECSSWAPSYHPYNSEDGNINGVEDHVSERRVSFSPAQAPEVSSPQLDLALEDELAELGPGRRCIQ